MIIETGRPRLRSQDCTGSTEECFVCDDPRSYVWAENARLYCLAEVPDRPATLPALLFGSLLLGAGIMLSRRNSSGLGWLGDEPPAAPASSFDPSRSTKTAYARTHIAKRFWGATVLSAQAAVSLDKLAGRVRSYNPDAAGQAVSVASMMKDAANQSGALALKYDEAWVRNRMRKSGIAFELEPGTT